MKMKKPEVEVIKLTESIMTNSDPGCGVVGCKAECNGGYGGDDPNMD